MPIVKKLSPIDRYDRFIKALRIQGIRLVKANLHANVASPNPSNTDLKIAFIIDEKLPVQKNGFEVICTLQVSFTAKEDGADLGRIDVEFAIRYDSTAKLDQESFELFVANNVPLNAWPYLREFVQSSMNRMGWPTFVLPSFKMIPNRKK